MLPVLNCVDEASSRDGRARIQKKPVALPPWRWWLTSELFHEGEMKASLVYGTVTVGLLEQLSLTPAKVW
jgi:hypothetical protein